MSIALKVLTYLFVTLSFSLFYMQSTVIFLLCSQFLVLDHKMIKCYLLQAFDWVLPVSVIDHIHCRENSNCGRS